MARAVDRDQGPVPAPPEPGSGHGPHPLHAPHRQSRGRDRALDRAGWLPQHELEGARPRQSPRGRTRFPADPHRDRRVPVRQLQRVDLDVASRRHQQGGANATGSQRQIQDRAFAVFAEAQERARGEDAVHLPVARRESVAGGGKQRTPGLHIGDRLARAHRQWMTRFAARHLIERGCQADLQGLSRSHRSRLRTLVALQENGDDPGLRPQQGPGTESRAPERRGEEATRVVGSSLQVREQVAIG